MSGTGERPVEDVDVVVVGASMRGLVTAFVAASLGHRTVVVEESARVGGADGSFVTSWGDRFDHGLHVLDSMRSELTTRVLSAAVEGRLHRVQLRRAIALRSHVMPYAPKPDEMPAELRRMLPSRDLVDDLGDEVPTRERLAKCYGWAFTDFVFDEVLPSFPSEARHLAFGIDESLLLANIYPWFFPRTGERAPSSDESRAFHDLLRSGVPQEVLYPEEGGFGGFADGFVRQLDTMGVSVLTGVGDVHVSIERPTRHIETVSAGKWRFRARHYLWAKSWPQLCALLDVACQDVATDRVVLGSFRLDRPAATPYHEILVGDPTMLVNRIHFPARFRESDDPLMQVEFAYPLREEGWSRPDKEWADRWVDDCRRLGILEADHRVERFDVRSLPMHFNAFGAEGEPLADADHWMLGDTNIHPVVPSMANLNLNRWVPRAVNDVANLLA